MTTNDAPISTHYVALSDTERCDICGPAHGEHLLTTCSEHGTWCPFSMAAMICDLRYDAMFPSKVVE